MLLRAAAFAMPLLAVELLAAQVFELDEEPIRYASSPAHDPVARLQERLDRGEVRLEFDERRGYLPAVLHALGVPVSSQVLVFSKTSFQRQRIGPDRPRAVYFSDDVYIGCVRGGEVIEVSAVDAELGAVFYTLDVRRTEKPRFERRQAECLQCHASSMTRGIPGHLVRSVYPDPDGQPILGAGTFLTDDASPLSERWGGWYVTGTHGAQRHMGNVCAPDRDHPDRIDFSRGANVTDLRGRFDTEAYLTPHSDLVALMVLEHQTKLHNLITAANYQTRLALRDQEVIRRMLGGDAAGDSGSGVADGAHQGADGGVGDSGGASTGDELTPSTRRRLEHACAPLLRYLLFSGEAALREPVAGTSDFAAEFAARGRRDRRGRSLRDFDLRRRLFRYPLSFLVYSEAIAKLPAELHALLFHALRRVLIGEDQRPEFAHLTAADRQAILEILLDTFPDLPSEWRPARVSEF